MDLIELDNVELYFLCFRFILKILKIGSLVFFGSFGLHKVFEVNYEYLIKI